jgi:hypothetical protein
MNRKEKREQFAQEISQQLKKWHHTAEDLNIGFVASAMLESLEKEGQNFMQSVYGQGQLLVSHAVANVSSVPQHLKKEFLSHLLESIMEVDEEVENRFKK